MDIVERIKQLMQDNELGAAAFADTIGVQRSSISHILSERNKPSLDFILKILHAYPNVSAEWLLKGIESENVVNNPVVKQDYVALEPKEVESPPDNTLPKRNSDQNIIQKPTTSKQVERIVVCYNDGTFSTYLNKN
jgi:transcriptional regulator with XRE-family HTH domain